MSPKSRAEYQQEYRQRHPNTHQLWRLRNPGYVWLKKRAAFDFIAPLKAQPCADCGGRFPSICMDFDHVRGEKKGDVATMVNLGVAVETIKEEVAKCELVCANCHRMRTADRRIVGREP